MEIEDRKQLEQRIAELERQLKNERQKQQWALEGEDSGLWEYDIKAKRLTQSSKLEGKWRDANLVVENYREQMKERNLIHPEDEQVFEAYCDSMDRGDPHIMYEMRILRDNGRFGWIRQEGNTIYDEKGVPVKVIGKVLDVTGEKRDNKRLEREVTRDMLTGLYNYDVARKMIEKKLQDPAKEAGALFLMDLDDFAEQNAAYGTVFGDSVLEMAANIVYTSFKAKDIVGRIDGDEFLVYASGICNRKDIENLLNKLMIRLSRFAEEREGNHCSISIGVAISPEDGRSYEKLYHSADLALYRAKKEGKSKYCFFDREENYDTSLGETSRKLAHKKKDQALAGQDYLNINKDLFDFAFKCINTEENFYYAIEKIFEEVCLYFGMDRSILLERDKGSDDIFVTAGWSREDDGNDREMMEQTSKVNWYVMEQYYRHVEYNILQDGRDGHEDYKKDITQMKRVPISAIQFPIMDGSKMAGVLTFESWTKRKWGVAEIATLSSITKMITSYLLQKQTKAELEMEYIVGKKAMDVQKLIYYVVGEEDHQIKFLSHYARECYPMARSGQLCYKAFMNRETPCPACPIQGLKEGAGQNTVEYYDEEEDNWYTLNASHMNETKVKKHEVIICRSNITTFLERVKGEDQLTGVMSYEKFKLEATRMLRRNHEEYGLAFLGIQDFSRINDEYGYEVGDQVLRTFAAEMSARRADDELVCRIKGDDFAALIKRRSVEQMRKNMQLFSELLTKRFRERFPGISINCFCGVYNVPDDEKYISKCLDKAMKARKLALNKIYEGGAYMYSKEVELEDKERSDMSRTIKDSLEKGMFRVYFQPKVDIVTGKIRGAEALVRLLDKEGKLISPGRFIPLAEENGQILEIDNFVYKETFRLMQKWQQEGEQVPLISVNVSRLHLLQDELPQYIKSLSDEYGLKPEQIELEITESVFFQDMERLVAIIKQMRDLGFVISMDDFGAGFSTLSLMKSLPVDVIKLDGSFFLKSELDDKNKAVIAAMLHLAENLGFEVIAEGVEKKEQVDFIRGQGGHLVQGYYYYKPMPADEFEKLLTEKK